MLRVLVKGEPGVGEPGEFELVGLFDEGASLIALTRKKRRSIKELFGNRPIVRLGKGSYGTCNLVQNKDLVVKLFNKTLAELRTAQNEIEVLQQLREAPGLQKLVGAWPDQLGLILQNAGKMVCQWNQSGKLPDTTKLKVIFSFAMAVRNIIDSGYVHNDLHSSNICTNFVDENEPVITIIDFGIATKIGEYMCYDKVSGIELHLAPELYDDVYSKSVPDLLKVWVTKTKSSVCEERPTIKDLIEILTRVLNH
ncbi:serine/threonine-protein kinase PEPKR2-like [Penaeus monodon]|uniref:serine/threonine-protein kinase PEPKR2-like n=1 Tax=Penaeus monodon TaxID=6687 RepID=UPI0018A7136F|nr:serine/threonine-protein kinase PEPKR2-like [Penaeus monodon]